MIGNKMMNVLIPTMPNDMHAIYVSLALKQAGHNSTMWYMADFPTKQTYTAKISNHHHHWKTNQLFSIDDPFDLIWNRRPQKPHLSHHLHPDDATNALNENLCFSQSLWHFINPTAIWVNDRINATKANSKILQLKKAIQVGFKIPKTIVSNDPIEIKKFIAHNKKEIIYKPLTPLTWKESDHLRLLYTKVIKIKDLPSHIILQNVPGIFQTKIKKAYELRITCMGNEMIAVKIDSQKHRKGKNDWRLIPTQELCVEIYDLPLTLKNLCLNFMSELGLYFGCFDIIRSEEGDYYFLEINEQGQFLWIEDCNPNIKMLDAFYQFLLQSTQCYQANKKMHPITLISLKEEAEMINSLALKNHVLPESL